MNKPITIEIKKDWSATSAREIFVVYVNGLVNEVYLTEQEARDNLEKIRANAIAKANFKAEVIYSEVV